MQRYGIIVVLWVGAYLSLWSQRTVEEVSDPRATALLEKLSGKFKRLNSYEVSFKLSFRMPEEEKVQVHRGVFVKSGPKYRIITKARKSYCDGQTLWIYLPENKEVQITDAEDGDEQFTSPDDILDLYKSGDYIYRMLHSETDDAVIEFKPTDRSVDYFKIKMAVDRQHQWPRRIEIFYKDGVRATLSFDRFETGKKYADAFFVFDKSKYPGVHVEDLRL